MRRLSGLWLVVVLVAVASGCGQEAPGAPDPAPTTLGPEQNVVPAALDPKRVTAPPPSPVQVLRGQARHP